MSEILTPVVTHPNSAELAEYVNQQGVALVIVNRNSEVLLVQQRESDSQYDRSAGQWNIVTETREDGERIRKTVRRAIIEELGIDRHDFQVIDGSYRETNGIYIANVGYRFKFRCIALNFTGDCDVNPNEIFFSHDDEIKQYTWVSFENLAAYDVEEGAQQVLVFYQKLLTDTTV